MTTNKMKTTKNKTKTAKSKKVNKLIKSKSTRSDDVLNIESVITTLQYIRTSMLIFLVAFVSIFIMFIFTILLHKNFDISNKLVSSNNHIMTRLLSVKSLELLPIEHLEVLKDSGYKIQLDTEKIKEYEEQSGTKAKFVISTEDKLIYINATSTGIDKATIYATSYVLADLLDVENKGIKECMKKEIEEFKGTEDLAKVRANKYFATIYTAYYTKQEYKGNNAEDFPETVNFIRSLKSKELSEEI